MLKTTKARSKAKQKSTAQSTFNGLLTAVQVQDHTGIARIIAAACTSSSANFSFTSQFGQADASNPAERTLLGLAVDTGCGKVVTALLSAKFIRNRINKPEKKDGRTYLYVATKRGVTAVVEALLAGAPHIDVNKACCEWERSPLHVAIANDDAGVVAALLAHPKINVNKASKVSKRSPLFLALEKPLEQRDWRIIEALLAAPNLDPNQTTHDGCTPLCLAITRHDDAAVTHLLAHPRIDPNATSRVVTDVAQPWPWQGYNQAPEQLTPLMVAVMSGFAVLARALVAHTRTDINQACGRKLQTPLCAAIFMLGFKRKTLLDAGSTPVGSEDGEAVSVRDAAFEEDAAFEKIFAGLIAAPGINANAADRGGRTPLMYASKWGFAECARALLMAGASQDPTWMPMGYQPLGLPTPTTLPTPKTALGLASKTGHEAEFAALFGSGIEFYHRTRHTEVGYSCALKQAVLTIMLVMQRQGRAQRCSEHTHTRTRTRTRTRTPPDAVGRRSDVDRMASGVVRATPQLPEELWLYTCSFLRSADFAVPC